MTVWAEFQFPDVNVSVVGKTVASPESPVETENTTSDEGCSSKTTVKVSVDPDSDTAVDPLDSVTVKPASASAVPEKGPSMKKRDAKITPR